MNGQTERTNGRKKPYKETIYSLSLTGNDRAMYESYLRRFLRSVKNAVVTLKMPLWMRDELHREAAKQGTTISAIITDYVLAGLAHDTQEQNKEK